MLSPALRVLICQGYALISILTMVFWSAIKQSVSFADFYPFILISDGSLRALWLSDWLNGRVHALASLIPLFVPIGLSVGIVMRVLVVN